MPDRQLLKAVADLREEIAQLGDEDAPARERLEGLAGDIERRLAGASDDEEGETLVAGLREAATQLEISNPRTTGILNRIMVALGSMGI